MRVLLGSGPHVEQVSAEGRLHPALCLRLPAARLEAVATTMGRSPHGLGSRLLVHDAALHQLSQLLWEEQEAGAPCGPLYTDALCSALMVRLLARHEVPLPLHSRSVGLPAGVLRKVAGYVETHLAGDLSRERLATVAGLSASHFSALFRASTRVSPHQFVLRRRVERARELLTTSTTPISTVALLVGFCDQSHLNRQMRRVLGVSPGDLRRTER